MECECGGVHPPFLHSSRCDWMASCPPCCQLWSCPCWSRLRGMLGGRVPCSPSRWPHSRTRYVRTYARTYVCIQGGQGVAQLAVGYCWLVLHSQQPGPLITARDCVTVGGRVWLLAVHCTMVEGSGRLLCIALFQHSTTMLTIPYKFVISQLLRICTYIQHTYSIILIHYAHYYNTCTQIYTHTYIHT